MASEIVRVDQFGLLTTGLRNIRCSITWTNATFELVPEKLVAPDPEHLASATPTIGKLMHDAKLVVEGALALRLDFESIMGMAVDADVDVDLFGGLHADWKNAPHIGDTCTFYPLLEIRNSAWKALLPDWRRRDDPLIRHFRIISAECSFDILAELVGGTWVANLPE